jgi:hypothetical protein
MRFIAQHMETVERRGGFWHTNAGAEGSALKQIWAMVGWCQTVKQ